MSNKKLTTMCAIFRTARLQNKLQKFQPQKKLSSEYDRTKENNDNCALDETSTSLKNENELMSNDPKQKGEDN
jgi:hypothetical protein